MFSRLGVNRDQRGSELSIGNQDVPVIYPGKQINKQLLINNGNKTANEYMKIIYLNCREGYEFMIDHHSYTHNLSSYDKTESPIQTCNQMSD